MADGSAPISRKVIREALATGLASGVSTAEAVWDYQRSDLGGQSPVIRVLAQSSTRPQLAQRGIRSEFGFVIQVWVLWKSQGGEWTEAEAEDQLDQLEWEIISWMVGNQNTDNWTALQYAQPTAIDTITIGGDIYLVEDIPVRVSVYG